MKNKELIERFIRYAEVDTQSSEESGTSPSTMKQHDLAKMLASELKEMGVKDVDYDEEHCYLYAGIPGDPELPALGFISHMDTSPAVSGAGVKPRILENYDGKDSLLKPEEFPELAHHIGEDLIATDGTTLLGADDKAGVAEIMNLAEYCMKHPDERRRTVRIAFTPDEEIGCGTDHFDIERFAAKEAYTVDGGKLGELEYENFNAASANIRISGRSVHPGDAKNLMVNAVLVGMELNALLPPSERPEHTEKYEGFYFLEEMDGTVDSALMKYLIRDHDRVLFEKRKETMQRAVDFINARYGEGTAVAEIRDQYYNMAGLMASHMDLIDRAVEKMKKLGIKPSVVPIRGGTDGASLTYRGLPCPNLCTGGYNYHGRYEYASIQEMEKAAELLIELAGA
ncbi:MAG: peptidase T [Lachnospiraceae bacterium]|jgi:tripeptide aminopeptidase|nr:peptidase T [Lachnospiraceae bacterium]